MAKYKHQQYKWTKRWTSVSHWWGLVGPIGALHFHISIQEDDKYPPSAGLEFHHTAQSAYRQDEAPDHIDCPLTGGPCWHDGTSLYATETIWPMVQPYLRAGDHERIFRLLEGEADRHFDELAATREIHRCRDEVGL